ncbi:MAG: arsenate reductase family protein [Longimicrobiales bacterium]
MNVQIFGIKKSADTRKALRFFKERRIPTHFVDVKEKPPSRRELLRFTQKLGVDALRDEESRRFQDLGLGAAYLSDDRWIETMMTEPLILRLPLVRQDKHVTVGYAPDVWKSWSR